MPRFPAVILAGGRSRRMGAPDKGLLPLGAKPVIGHVIAGLAPQVARIAINTNSDPVKFARFGLPVLADTIGGFEGPLAGILTAMLWARAGGASHVVTTPCDAPFLPDDLVEALGAKSNADTDIVIASCAGRLHPVMALWPAALAQRLEDHLLQTDRRSVLEWLDNFRVGRAEFSQAMQFANLNQPEDLREAACWRAGAVDAVASEPRIRWRDDVVCRSRHRLHPLQRPPTIR